MKIKKHNPFIFQDTYDDLCSDFARICQQQIAAKDAVRTYEQDLTAEMELVERSKGSEKDAHAKKQAEATELLAKARSELEKVNAERSRIEKLLEKMPMNEEKSKPMVSAAGTASQPSTPSVNEKSSKKSKSKK